MVQSRLLPKPFWVVWTIELWERFGYYGMQAIVTLYFVQYLGFSARASFAVFGAFFAFTYGFIWIGGKIGDEYFGAKRTLLLGAVILMLAYASLGAATKATVFYSLAGIVVGNALFKANPSSLISKLFDKGDPALDGAMTMYYMAINIGSFFSTLLTPIIAIQWGWDWAFYICAIGLVMGLCNYLMLRHWLGDVSTKAGQYPWQWSRFTMLLLGSVVGIMAVSFLLRHLELSNMIVYAVVVVGIGYFLKIAFAQKDHKTHLRMMVAAVLIFEGFIFFVLYAQMPMSLLFLAKKNVNNLVWGIHIPPAEYIVLNALTIVIMSPILAWLYRRIYATHITKFCIGMTLCACAFLVLWLPQFFNHHGLISPWWMVATYYLQSTGELLISGLGLAMVAELCPKEYSGLVMGVWFLSSMLAGPVAGWIGGLTQAHGHAQYSMLHSLQVYTHVFGIIGVVVLAVSIVMWLSRPWLNRVIAH